MKIAHSLETDSHLMALRRFIGRRGQAREIRSDNGTNFTGGERELRESINAWNHNKIHEALLQKNTKWIFNPQIGQISEAFGKAVFARSKTRILCGDAGGDKNNILPKLFGNDGLENICPCFRADKNGHCLVKILAVGDIVQISTENSPRNTWPLRRVFEVLLDRKGLVRCAKVKVKRTVVERPIDKLCLHLEA